MTQESTKGLQRYETIKETRQIQATDALWPLKPHNQGFSYLIIWLSFLLFLLLCLSGRLRYWNFSQRTRAFALDTKWVWYIILASYWSSYHRTRNIQGRNVLCWFLIFDMKFSFLSHHFHSVKSLSYNYRTLIHWLVLCFQNIASFCLV